MSQNTPCALLCAAGRADKAGDRPCALPEDESADPVGDGHSDAEWAQRHPPPSTDSQDNSPKKKPA